MATDFTLLSIGVYLRYEKVLTRFDPESSLKMKELFIACWWEKKPGFTLFSQR